MRNRRLQLRVTLVALSLALISSTAQAQWRIGGFLGAEHESSWDEFLLLGFEARGGVARGAADLAPRFSYFLRDGMTRYQIDVNLIKPLVLASPIKVVPYLGVGAALAMASFDGPGAEDETAVGLNYVVGGTWRTTGALEPYAQFQYSVLHDAFNVSVVTVGLLYRIGGASAGAR